MIVGPPESAPTEVLTTQTTPAETTQTPEDMDNDPGNLSFILAVSVFAITKNNTENVKKKKKAFQANNTHV